MTVTSSVLGERLQYPAALRDVTVVEDYHGVKIVDPYRWLEDPEAEEVKEFVQNQVKLTDSVLGKYSLLHNVKRPWEQQSDKIVEYPSTMLLTADHDDRVVPLHSLKLLATMQHVLCTSLENSSQTNPIIGRIEVKAGHGAGRPTQKMIDEAAHRYSFMAKVVNASWTE